MSIIKKLIAIQSELKAPKDLRNNFGGYNFRSAESILEALKPILKEQGVYLSLTDSIELIGNRYYIKATATIEDEEGNSRSVTAFAREEESKKGMDGSQITGAASSYARKYSLNGLFGIDDTKDSDATNTHGKEEVKPATPTQPTEVKNNQPIEPKSKVKIIQNSETWKKAVIYLSDNGLKAWENVKDKYDIPMADEVELLKQATEAIKNKTNK